MCMGHSEHRSSGRVQRPNHAAWYAEPSKLALLSLLVVAAFFLWTEHRAHVVPYLPYLLVLLCPLMHIFMHRSHAGGNGNHKEHDTRRDES